MSPAKLSFFKLIVRDLETSQRFYEQAFGFTVSDRFDTPEFGEVILAQEDAGLSLILLSYKDGRALPDAASHGPTGFLTGEIEATHAAIVAAGGTPKGPILAIEGGVKVAFLADPEGHEIELCQFP